MIKHRTIIIPASVQPNARALCKGLAGIAGDGMFTTGLSATGKAPATHYISSGPISHDMAALLPCKTVTQDKDGKLARIARYQGADAAARFAAEKAKAKGTTEDRGNGLSVSTDPYLGKDVQAGDEAFCTTGDPLSFAGVLVRTGDTLVYVSTTAAGDGASAVPQIDFGAAQSGRIGFKTDEANCNLAVQLAVKAH